MEKMDDNADTPYTPLKLIEEKAKPAWFFGYVHVTLIVLAALPFLYCWASPLLLEYRAGWQHAQAFLFVIGYIGLFFRRAWAYWIAALVAGTWVVQIGFELKNAIPDPEEPGLVMIFSTLSVVFAIWSAVIVLLAAICALNCRRQQKNHGSSENMEF